MNNRYMMRGVSAAKEDVHNAIKNIDKGVFPGPSARSSPTCWEATPTGATSCTLMERARSRPLAYMYWKETGDLNVWKGIAQDAIVMNTDDLLCVGAVDNILVSSTIGRNKMLIPAKSFRPSSTARTTCWLRCVRWVSVFGPQVARRPT